MEIKKGAVAGTLESSDIMIAVEPNSSEKNVIILKSIVEKQFGEQIMAVITEGLNSRQIKNAHVTATDKGALDCTIKARLATVLYRACESEVFDWEVMR